MAAHRRSDRHRDDPGAGALRINAETNERDAASYDTRADTNNCFGEIPAKREILKATTFARVAFAQINVCRNRR